MESLLDKAKDSQDYDVSLAADQLTSYLLSEDGEVFLNELIEQIIEGVDSLGSDAIVYMLEASRAVAINDEVKAARALVSLYDSIMLPDEDSGRLEKLRTSVVQTLPEPTPIMRQSWKILNLLGARGSNADIIKMVPIIRKLGQEPRIQRATAEVAAALGERLLSRSLRLAFGLPQPSKQ